MAVWSLKYNLCLFGQNTSQSNPAVIPHRGTRYKRWSPHTPTTHHGPVCWEDVSGLINSVKMDLQWKLFCQVRPESGAQTANGAAKHRSPFLFPTRSPSGFIAPCSKESFGESASSIETEGNAAKDRSLWPFSQWSSAAMNWRIGRFSRWGNSHERLLPFFRESLVFKSSFFRKRSRNFSVKWTLETKKK